MKNIRLAETLSKVAEWLRSQKILVIGLILVVIIALPGSSPAQFLPSPCRAILCVGLAACGLIRTIRGVLMMFAQQFAGSFLKPFRLVPEKAAPPGFVFDRVKFHIKN